MIKFCPLFSGSSGNCIFVGTDHAKLLVDAGVSAVRISKALASIGEDPAEIDAIFITHEHSDHTRGAGIFARRFGTKIYANKATWEAMSKDIGDIFTEQRNVLNNSDYNEINIGDITVFSFPVSHDAAAPSGYYFVAGQSKISVCTDTGYDAPEIMAAIKGSQAVLLESNHDIEMLKNGIYPPPLKKRILGKKGHLSNVLASEIACELCENGTRCIILGHLSKENNRPDICYCQTEEALKSKGFDIVGFGDTVPPDFFRGDSKEICLCVASRDEVGKVVMI